MPAKLNPAQQPCGTCANYSGFYGFYGFCRAFAGSRNHNPSNAMPKQNEIILRSADTIRHFVADWNKRIPGSIATYELTGKAKAWHVTITAAQGRKLIVIAPRAALLPLSAESADTLLRGTHKLCIG